MALPTNNNQKGNKGNKNQKSGNQGSKFILKASNKTASSSQKIRKAGGTRGS